MVIMVIVQYCNNKSRLNNDVDMVWRMKRSGMVFEKKRITPLHADILVRALFSYYYE